MPELSPARLRLLRIAALPVLLALVPGLFVGGAQPVAVGLIPVPWDKVAHCVLFAGFAGLIGLAAGLLPLRRGVLLWLAFAAGAINAKYGTDPGQKIYTHVSDQYAPFHSQLISATAAEAPRST